VNDRRSLLVDIALAAWLIVVAGLYFRQFSGPALAIMARWLGRS
jgi:hypothetical protein